MSVSFIKVLLCAALADCSTPLAKCSAALTITVADNQLLSHNIGEIAFFISIAGTTGE